MTEAFPDVRDAIHSAITRYGAIWRREIELKWTREGWKLIVLPKEQKK